MARDLTTALVCLAASLLLFALTLDLPGPSLLVPIGPGYYPRIILGITALLSAVLAVQTLLAYRRARRAPSLKSPTDKIGGTSTSAKFGSDPNYALVAWSFGVFGAYVALLPLLGFRIATLGFMLGVQWLLGRPRTAKGWLVACIVAIVTALATFHLFQDYLSVLLPRGRWTGL
jgi:putative tricarboxylic transport membrane protein